MKSRSIGQMDCRLITEVAKEELGTLILLFEHILLFHHKFKKMK